MATHRSLGFRGRASERAVLDHLLGEVRGGRSAALVIRGEAGVGKTALLRYCVERASGFRIARSVGIESEMELPFAGLHQLCAPMLSQLAAVPEPQRNALTVAFGLSTGDPPDRFLIALAVLSLLSAVAEERHLLCIVADAHWLDRASAQVLGFVARRLLGEAVALVFAVREGTDEPELTGLPGLKLAGLDDQDARALLASVFPGRLDARVRDRIVSETRGNPLALLELPRGLTAAELAGGFALPDAGSVAARIEDNYLRRLLELPDATQRLMLLVAALLQAARRLEALDVELSRETYLEALVAAVYAARLRSAPTWSRLPWPLVRHRSDQSHCGPGSCCCAAWRPGSQMDTSLRRRR
jgi:hypothetical protein